MLISIVIPVYNTLQYLPDCLKSVEECRFEDMEVVLVDDGSDDGSSEFCDEYKRTHENVTVIHQKNAGASAARNAGLTAAVGEYIHFVDSDDMLESKTAYDRFYRDIYPASPDIVFSRCRTYSDDFSRMLKDQPAYLSEGVFCGDTLCEVLKNRYQLTMTSPVNKIFRRGFLLDNHLFFVRGLRHEEDEWLPRVISCAQKVYFFNALLYAARYQRNGALSQITSDKNMTEDACSMVYIASSGMAYMEKRSLSAETLSLIAEYYWDYLTDACVLINRLDDKQDRKRVCDLLRENRAFFKTSRYLKSRNKRIMGWMFRLLGVRLTVRFIGLRYGK